MTDLCFLLDRKRISADNKNVLTHSTADTGIAVSHRMQNQYTRELNLKLFSKEAGVSLRDNIHMYEFDRQLLPAGKAISRNHMPSTGRNCNN